jgi:hypothetical protein
MVRVHLRRVLLLFALFLTIFTKTEATDPASEFVASLTP